MLKNIFYCPKCEKTETNMNVDNFMILWANTRGGWGRPIYHIICPQCLYNLSGYINNCGEDEIEYVKYTIGMYST